MPEWHAVRLKPGAEGKALIGIGATHMVGFMPVELVRVVHRGERWVSWRPLFPAHIFVTIDPSQDIPKLREIDGVEDLLRPGGRLAPIAGEVIEAIRHAEQQGVFDGTSELRLTNGHDVLASNGSFAPLVAKIKAARWSKKRMEVLMTLPLLSPRRH
jgi:transcription antitermination factor NusG